MQKEPARLHVALPSFPGERHYEWMKNRLPWPAPRSVIPALLLAAVPLTAGGQPEGGGAVELATTASAPTLVCDGKSGYTVETFGHGPGAEINGECLVQHELHHKKDYLVACPVGCS